MLAVGDPVPDATVWTGTRESSSVRALAEGGPILLVFYLYDWSST